MSLPDDAVALFNQRFNCSQAVLATCGPKYGLNRLLALHVAEAFRQEMSGALDCRRIIDPGRRTGPKMVLAEWSGYAAVCGH
jgi:hypothetical protein